MKRVLAAGVAFAALVPMLAGCSAGEADLESRLSELSGVSGAFVWTTMSGLPTNRGYAIRLYVEQESVDDLTGLVDDALRTTWTHAAFNPTNGISIQVAEGQRPTDPEPGGWGEDRLALEEAVRALPLDEDSIGVGLAGTSVRVWEEALTTRYGQWGSDR